MMTYAVDAAVAVALANTLFFAAATAESKTNVALYLAITVAPFAVVAPVIGPLLDRLQRGRRAALAVSFGGRAVLAVVMAFSYDSWLLYPAALGVMVLSKSFVVLKAAVTPAGAARDDHAGHHELPAHDVRAGRRARCSAAVAAGVAALWGSPGALFFTAALGVAGVVLCLRIPRWVEVTEGEVPATLREPDGDARHPTPAGRADADGPRRARRAVGQRRGPRADRVPHAVRRVRRQGADRDRARPGSCCSSASSGRRPGLGSFLGNAIGSRQRFDHSDALVLSVVGIAATAAAFAAFLPGHRHGRRHRAGRGDVQRAGQGRLDAVVQRDLPERSRASAFGRSETVLQLAWVFGGALGVLLPHDTFRLGFGIVAGVMVLVGIQAALVGRGRTLLPLPGRRRQPGRPPRR